MNMEEQIKSAMLSYGIPPPDHIRVDSHLHRFGKGNDCWYVFHGDGIPAGSFGDWSQNDESNNWHMDIGRELTADEREINRLRMEEAKKIRDAEKERAHNEAKIKAKSIWEESIPAVDHSYLLKKSVKAHGARVYKDKLVIPMRNATGELCSLQFIDADGGKRFMYGGQVKGCYYRIGKPNGNICIAEGFATAATIHQATGYAVIVAFSCSKMFDCAMFIRSIYPNANIIICADVDKDPKSTVQKSIEVCTKAAEAVNGVMLYPEDLPEGSTDFNDMADVYGIERVRKSIIKEVQTVNVILDSDVKYSTIDILKHIEDDHIIKKLALEVAEKAYLPPSTVLLSGLGVFSSVACRKYSIAYQDKEKLPIGLYVVAEQPSGSGKSRCLRAFQKPFYEISENIFDEIRLEMAKLSENDGSLTDDEKVRKEQLLAKMRILGTLFTTNATPEALEKGLLDSNGFFSAISSEQGLFNSLFGSTYKAAGSSNNYDVVLNGYDGGHLNTSRVTRKGYCGTVVGSIVCFAQSGSIETLLNSSNGIGLSERFLMLAEPHNLGRRDHERELNVSNYFYDEYNAKCADLKGVVEYCDKFESTTDLYISDNGFGMIQAYLNSIEPFLIDGGKYSHTALRGAASKINMQIMKVAANLSLLGEKLNFWGVVDDKYVDSAISISNELIEANLSLCQNKGVMGHKAEFEAILRLFEDSNKPKLERAIIQSRSNVKPFRDFSGNKSDRIREVLNLMVDQKILRKIEIGGTMQYTAI